MKDNAVLLIVGGVLLMFFLSKGGLNLSLSLGRTGSMSFANPTPEEGCTYRSDLSISNTDLPTSDNHWIYFYGKGYGIVTTSYSSSGSCPTLYPLSGGLYVVNYSSTEVRLCKNKATSGYDYKKFTTTDADASSAVLSTVPVAGYEGKEICPACVPVWNCGSWSVCDGNQQFRLCHDDNGCSPDRNESQSCTYQYACIEITADGYVDVDELRIVGVQWIKDEEIRGRFG